MTKSLPRMVHAAGLALVFSAGAASAQMANGPYYATPSWDQTLPTSSRFIVSTNFANQAVLDRETGLVWLKAPDLNSVSYDFAFQRCTFFDQAGRTGWRLPNISELTSLFDFSVGGVGIAPFPAGHPFTVPTPGVGVSIWTTTSGTSSSGPTRAIFGYSINLMINQISRVIGNSVETQTSSTWCVRAPGNAGTDR